MDIEGTSALRTSTLCFGVALAAVVILSLGGVPHTVGAQSPPAEQVIYNFAPATGNYPTGLTGDSAGNLYAVTSNGGNNRKCIRGCGSILRFAVSGQATTLYTFTLTDGSMAPEPVGLIRDPQGNLYTATGVAGLNRLGSILKVTPSGSAGNLYSFQGGNDGEGPASGPTMDSRGNLYGTTFSGGGTGCGGQGCGVIYKLTRSGSETVLYRFTGGADGEGPAATPTLDSAGTLYGTALLGGDLDCPIFPGTGCGTAWKLDTSGNLTVLYSFTGGGDGGVPHAGLAIDPSGNLYGDAFYGGSPTCDCGTVFKIDSSGNFMVLYTFVGGSNDGMFPAATLLRGLAGNLYGTTSEGGNQSCSGGCGIAFKLDASGNETVLHFFAGGGTDGATPGSEPMVSDSKRNVYGITPAGGLASSGVIFQVQTQ